jgi:hypothetical protein
MSFILTAPSNPGVAKFGSASAVTGTPQTFTFQPGGVPGPGVFITWPFLVAGYRTWKAQTESPTFSGVKKALIALDDTYAPIVIPTLPDLSDFELVAETGFINAKSLFGGNDHNMVVVATISSGVVWRVTADAGGLGLVNVSDIFFLRAAGATAAWLKPSAAPVMTQATITLVNSKMRNLSSSASAPIFGDPSVDISIVLLKGSSFLNGPGKILSIGTGKALSVVTQSSILEADTFTSTGVLGTTTSSVDADSQIGLQKGATLPDFVEMNGPSASANVRPGPNITVLSGAQLANLGPSGIPVILQAFGFTLTVNPSNGDTFSITDGVTTETFTFKAIPAGAFDVLIGGTASGSLSNLATAIAPASALWKGAFTQNPQTGANAVAVIRKVQLKEFYPDRAFGSFVGGGAFAIRYSASGSGVVRLTYSGETVLPLPAVDPQAPFSGFGTNKATLDGFLTIIIDNRSDGIYMAKNAVGAGMGTWAYIGGTIDPALFIPPGGGVFPVMRSTRFVVATLAGVDVTTIPLPNYFPPAVPLAIRRTDAAAGATLTLAPAGAALINGLASIPVPVASGLVIYFDGTNWWTV